MTECEVCHGRGWVQPTPKHSREFCPKCGGRGTISPFLGSFDYQGLLKFEKGREKHGKEVKDCHL